MHDKQKIFMTFDGTRKRTPRSNLFISGQDKLAAANKAETCLAAKSNNSADNSEECREPTEANSDRGTAT